MVVVAFICSESASCSVSDLQSQLNVLKNHRSYWIRRVPMSMIASADHIVLMGLGTHAYIHSISAGYPFFQHHKGSWDSPQRRILNVNEGQDIGSVLRIGRNPEPVLKMLLGEKKMDRSIPVALWDKRVDVLVLDNCNG